MPSFGAWQPDKYGLNTGLAGEARGVLPGANSYLPWLALQAFSEQVGETPCGAIICRKTDDSYVLFAGSRTKLYKFIGAGDPWLDVSRLSGGAYSVASDEFWSFRQFRDNLIAVNGADVPQYIDINLGANFDALPGDPPRARFCEIIGDQVFLYGLTDNPTRLQWSGTNNAGQWTVGKNNSDYQDFPDGGHVVGASPLETGLIFQSGQIRRIIRVDNQALFAFQLVEGSRGLVAPNSLCIKSNLAFYLSEEGFQVTDGAGGSRGIGSEVVDQWFQSDSNYDRLNAIVGAVDPLGKRIFWAYPSAGNVTTTLDRMLCYHIELDRWTHADVNLTYLFPAATPAYTADTVDVLLGLLGYTLETCPFSLDSRFLKGGAPSLAAFDPNGRVAFFAGASMAATVETSDWQPVPNRRVFVRGVRIFGDTDQAAATVGVKPRPQDAITWGASSALNAQGYCPVRTTGQEIRVRVEVPAGASWTHVQGVDVDGVPEGMR